MSEEKYQTTRIQRGAHVPKAELNHWINAGIIEPLRNERGRGKSRIFSFQNLLEILVCRELWLLHLPPRVYGPTLAEIGKENGWQRMNQEGSELFLVVGQFGREIKSESGAYSRKIYYEGELVDAKKPDAMGKAIKARLTAMSINLSSLAIEARGV
jgi:hypothetical protein